MTAPQINTKALEEAINEVKDERFQKDLREWLIYSAPPEVTAIWKRYIDKVEQEETTALKQGVLMGWVVVIFIVGAAVYTIAKAYMLRGCLP